MSDTVNALVVHEVENADLVPSFVMSIKEAEQQIALLQSFVKSVMVPNEDYGVIPGTQKPTLLKPGAEKLCEIYGYAPEADVTNRIEDWDKPFFHYEVRVSLRSKRTGRIVGQGLGSCNSREKRYADRWVWSNEVPAEVDKARLQKREFTGRNGQTLTKYLMPNEDVCTLVNTVLKMAKKRALIDAVLSVTRSSGLFTQDLEDIVDAEASPAPAAQASQPAQPARSAPPPRGRPAQNGQAEKPKATLADFVAKYEHVSALAAALGAKPPKLDGSETMEQIADLGQECVSYLSQWLGVEKPTTDKVRPYWARLWEEVVAQALDPKAMPGLNEQAPWAEQCLALAALREAVEGQQEAF